MSKYDGKIRAAAEVSGDLGDLLASLAKAQGEGVNRHDAMANYLSGAEGWREARKKLRGTFAGPVRTRTNDGGDAEM